MRTRFQISRRDTEGKSKKVKGKSESGLQALFAFTFLLLPLALFVAPLRAQTSVPAQAGADKVELYQALLDLTNSWTVMCVAAHPDDEDGATLTVLRRKYGAHTVTLFSTFGEGGQNAIGPELYEELGAIRARETLKAAEIQGSEAHFLALRDFGFSKSAEEAFRFWGREEALRRMVLEIRRLRPDVIITNHDTTSGHGHHQATGRLVEEAFDAAADPKRFPEQLQETSAWQPQRLFVRVNYEGGTGSKKSEDEAVRAGKLVSIDPNERDAVRGSTYAEQALQALRQHASQGPWPTTVPQTGAPIIRYRLAREAQKAAPLPAQAQTFLDGIPLPKSVERRLSMLRIEGRPLFYYTNQRDRVLETLANVSRTEFVSDDESDYREHARVSLLWNRINTALAIASGIKLTITPQDEALVPQTPASFSIVIANQGNRDVQLRHVSFAKDGQPLKDQSDLKMTATLTPRASITLTVERELPANTPSTVPHAAHLYDSLWRGERFHALIVVNMEGTSIGLGEETWVDVAPAVEMMRLSPSPYVLTPATLNKHLTFKLSLVNHLNKSLEADILTGNQKDSIHEVGLKVTLAAQEKRETEVKSNAIPVDGPDERRNPQLLPESLQLSVSATGSSKPVTEQKVRIVYSEARVAPRLRVGYVRSFDETLRNALDALGVESKELTVEDVRAGDLRKYDTIVIDNRGYQAHPELVAANPRLLEFAREGGTLIVFYHKANEWNPDAQKNRPQLAPLPITLGNDRVTDENAPIAFNDAQHPLLIAPNRITQDDFKDWVQERGLYFPRTWDAQYRAPFSMSDTGETPLRGGLLALDYGRGHYIYTSMVWYRQLRAGIPGAYRVFANMISFGK